MRIGIQTWGSRGDIVPALALGQGLQKNEHDVTIFYSNGISNEDFSHYSKSGLTVRSTIEFRKNTNLIDNMPIKQVYDMDIDTQTTYMMDEIFEPFEDEIERAAIHLCENCDLILTNPILYQTHALAEKYDIPLLLLLVDYQFVPKQNNELFDTEINRIFKTRIDKYRKKHSLPLIVNVRKEVFNSDVLNLLTFSNIFKDNNINLNPRFKISGFMEAEDSDEFEFPESLQKFLSEEPAPVFFSVGSLTFFEGTQEEIIELFLEAIHLSDCRAIIQTNWNKTDRPRPIGANIYTIDYIPHNKIFPHCIAVVHHGGAGTTHTALRAGCPSIVVAYAWDQFDWGKKLTNKGASPSLIKRKYVDALQIAGDIRKIVTDPEYKLRAEEVRRKMKRENGVKKAVKLIEETIEF